VGAEFTAGLLYFFMSSHVCLPACMPYTMPIFDASHAYVSFVL